MRLLADTNIVAMTVKALRALGHDVVHTAEWGADPGDAAILSEAYLAGRVLVTKDHDVGALVFRDGAAHVGVLLIDDLGSPSEESELVVDTLGLRNADLDAGGFVRAGKWGSKVADPNL